jgi:hypothetical protein
MIRLFAFSVLIGSTLSTSTFANDNCERLESLAREYAGVELTSYQKQIKVKLVAWYGKNCRGRQREAAN